MIVRDLIFILQSLPDDAEVFATENTIDGAFTIEQIVYGLNIKGTDIGSQAVFLCAVEQFEI